MEYFFLWQHINNSANKVMYIYSLIQVYFWHINMLNYKSSEYYFLMVFIF